MDPRLIAPEHWVLVNHALNGLVLFVFLAVNAALSFLVAHAIIPSLVSTGDAPPSVAGFRRFLYPLSLLSLIAAGWAFSRALAYGIAAIQQIYPRFAI